MNKSLVVSKTIQIQASNEAVWDALINPKKIAQYLYGTETITTWEVNSPILFQGEYEGHRYKDKGIVVEFLPNRSLIYDYWSQFSQLPDTRENYSRISCQISSNGEDSVLSMTQTGFGDETGMNHSEKSWDGVMLGIKKVSEES